MISVSQDKIKKKVHQIPQRVIAINEFSAKQIKNDEATCLPAKTGLEPDTDRASLHFTTDTPTPLLVA